MTLYEKILERQNELKFNDPEVKREFLETLPSIIDYFQRSERLSKDIEEIFLTSLYDLSFNLMDEKSFNETYPEYENAGGLFQHIDGKDPQIALKSKNKSTLVHEFVHFIKWAINKKHKIQSCPKWIDEPMTELVTSDIVGYIHGYMGHTTITKQFIKAFDDFSLDDYFYDNMKEYRKRNPLFNKLYEFFGDVYKNNLGKNQITTVLNALLSKMMDDKLDEQLSEPNAKLSYVLKSLVETEFNNKLTGCYHEGEEFDNLYVRAIRTFCKENGYNILGDKHSLENLKKLIKEYRQSAYLEKENIDPNSITCCDYMGKTLYVSETNGRYKVARTLPQLLVADEDRQWKGVTCVSIGSNSFGHQCFSEEEPNKIKIIYSDYDREKGSLFLDPGARDVSDLQNINKNELKVLRPRSSNEIFKEIISSINASVIDAHYQKEVSFLERTNPKVSSNKKKAFTEVLQELNEVAHYLGSKIIVCEKELLVNPDFLLTSVGHSIVKPEEACRVETLNVQEVNNIDQSLDLEPNTQCALYMRTVDGASICVGSLFCQEQPYEGESINLYFKRDALCPYLSDEMKERLWGRLVQKKTTSPLNDKI